jgi:hypothetical protein
MHLYQLELALKGKKSLPYQLDFHQNRRRAFLWSYAMKHPVMWSVLKAARHWLH